uniref:ATP-dependent Clp protease proteolytic subunit n=1 Tax=Dunalia brachyacantha TaxID=362345 RepID=A0A0E3M6P4_9SOLA|nr:clp protease proteolytic subunit [Dunalia brachyacantha]AKA66557.1 clp protease proteolytic subunit [Dunalia brachyacantha]
MPIGVPKVPFRFSGDRLYRERLLFLSQGITSELSNQLIGLLVFLSMEDDAKEMHLFINSPGGWVIPGIALYDTMQIVLPEIHTVCVGLAASMASFILVGGEITKRIAFPHACRVMMHQPASGFYMAQVGEFVLEAEELLKLRETLTRVYAQRTGNPLWVVSEDLERDIFMSATEAQAYGIVDLVAVQ